MKRGAASRSGDRYVTSRPELKFPQTDSLAMDKSHQNRKNKNRSFEPYCSGGFNPLLERPMASKSRPPSRWPTGALDLR
jgi:hypothetical protein